MKNIKEIKGDIFTVTLLDDDLLYYKIENEKSFNLTDFFQMKDAAFSFGRGKKYFNIIDLGELTIPEPEVRNESASEKGCEFKKADAFVIYTLPQRIIGDFYMKINKPTVPTRFFNSIESAKLWIEELR